MNIFKLFVFLPIIATLFSGCIIKYDDDYDYKDECSSPVYMSYKKLRDDYPKILPPREIGKAGKIYIFGNILLINEKNVGIHIVDNTNRQEPIPKSFISIPGNVDMAVKDGYLYVDSFIDMIVLNINDINNIVKVHREEKVFPYNPTQILTEEDMKKDRCYGYGYDDTKGVIIGYE